MSNWISVDDRLPKGRNQWGSSWWMAARKTHIPYPVTYIDGVWTDEWGAVIHDVTHWQPLPEPPMENEDKKYWMTEYHYNRLMNRGTDKEITKRVLEEFKTKVFRVSHFYQKYRELYSWLEDNND